MLQKLYQTQTTQNDLALPANPTAQAESLLHRNQQEAISLSHEKQIKVHVFSLL